MKRIVFLMSDTGGGHRAAGRAIEAALAQRYPDNFETFYADVFREYSPPPWKYAPEIYPKWVKHSITTYGWYFWIFDRLMQLPLVRHTFPGLIAEGRMTNLVADYAPDVLVVLHGAFSRFVVGARQKLGLDIPIITVITDLARPHVAWYHPGVDRCLVPCQEAYELGAQMGVPRHKLRVVGHPAHPKFMHYTGSKADARRELGWDPDKPAVMLLGGGEGMGALDDIALAINAQSLDGQMAIVCGRNEALRAQLETVAWNMQAHVYGFCNNIEVMMRAADVLVTKAGPGTIAEAAISGVPMILSGAIPFQESPNVDWVIKHQAGVYETTPEGIAAQVAGWFEPDNPALPRLADSARRIAYPRATYTIADEIAQQCGISVPD